MQKKYSLALLFFLLFLCTACAAEIESPIEIQGVHVKLVAEASGNISGNMAGLPATIEILSYKDTEFQKVLSLEEYLIINGQKIEASNITDSYGNNFAVFTVNETGSFTYFIEAEIQTNYAGRGFGEYLLSKEITSFQEFAVATELVESDNAGIRTIAFNELDSNGLLETIRQTTEWVHSYIEYDSSFIGSNASALDTLNSKKGVCSQYSELAAALLRAKGIPARFVVGTVYSGDDWGNHAWLQVYNPNSGWINLDATYGEAGFVDGTHIAMGFFPDPLNAADNAQIATTAEIELGKKNISVELLDSQKFSKAVEINAESIETTSENWFEIKFSVKNLYNEYFFTPVFLYLPKDFIANPKEQTLLLKPGEDRKISISAFANLSLEENQFLQGEYLIAGFFPLERNALTIRKAIAKKIPANVLLNEITPLLKGKNLVIEVLLENSGTEPAEISIDVKSPSVELHRKETLAGLEERLFLVTVGNYKVEPHMINITAPGLDFEKQIVLKESTAGPPQNNATVPPANPPLLPDLPAGIPLGTTEIVLLAAAAISCIVIVIVLKTLSRR